MSIVKGFVKAQGQKLINEDGQELLFRGVGLGGWLLPEGYMWRFPEQGDRPRRMEKLIIDLVGEQKAKEFWKTYYERYTSEADICRIAKEGFNSVRIPVNSRFLIKEYEPVRYNDRHLKIIDNLIEWCRKYGLYVILDLHGAPGGQTGTNIDDSENNRPELFTNGKNRQLTIELWGMLAKRYRNEWIIAGYDLLNEPLPQWFSEYNREVMPLYRDIIKEIRKVDERHMIILEGVHWATDWSIFEKKPDDNLMLQFHKYWNNPDTESIQEFLDKGGEWKVPIFMGEGGENNPDWVAGAFRLCEDHNISWNFWTWKKMGGDNSPCIIKTPSDWSKLAAYLEGGIKPDGVTAQNILDEFLNNLSTDKCEYHREIVDALLRRPPVRIPAVFYGYRGEGISFGWTNRKASQIKFRKNDGMGLGFVEGAHGEPNFKHMQGQPWAGDEWMYVQLAGGDWVAYEFSTEGVAEASLFTVSLCMCAVSETGIIEVSIDGTAAAGILVKNTDAWEVVCPDKEFDLVPGQHRIVLKAPGSPVRILWLKLYPAKDK